LRPSIAKLVAAWIIATSPGATTAGRVLLTGTALRLRKAIDERTVGPRSHAVAEVR
jgi:hypothetical protein